MQEILQKYREKTVLNTVKKCNPTPFKIRFQTVKNRKKNP